MKKDIKYLLFVFVVTTFFVSCDLSLFGTNNRSRQYSIVSPGEISQIPTDDFFYVNIKSAHYTGEGFDPLDFLLYAKEEGPGTDCKVQFTDDNSSTEDLFCMFEVAEGDLYLHNIHLEYNVPPGMCNYLSFMVHWHYNYESGDGPPYVAQIPSDERDDNGNQILEYTGCKVKPKQVVNTPGRCSHSNCRTQLECEIASFNCHSPETTAGVWTEATYRSQCPRDQKVGREGDNHSEVCGYILTEDDKTINCCLGEYTLYEGGNEKGESHKWGGDIKDCIGGLGRINWDSFDDYGFPIPLVTPTGSKGLIKPYELDPLIDKIKGLVSFPLANFYEGIGEDDETTPPDFRNTSAFVIPEGEITNKKSYPYLTWSCLDQNYEVRHQINLIIREWNTQEEFTRFKESEGSRGDSDTGGTEGSECDYYEKSALPRFGDCNDLDDLDDFTGDYPELTYQ